MEFNAKQKTPRNACTACRVRKSKCVTTGIGVACERCLKQGITCSYLPVPNLGFSRRSQEDSPQSQSPLGPHVSQDSIFYSIHHPIESQLGYDIGNGTAPEILRESELTRDLLELYFENFGDIHFMFDKDLFLRQFALGEAPKILVYSMMALGIKYSKVTIFDGIPRTHRGEILFREARKMLKVEYDHPSLTTIQAYVLASTYHLTFGGSRKAWIHLGIASSMCKILRLADDNLEDDPLYRELARRLCSTVAMMDLTLSPSLNLPCYFSASEYIPEPCTDEELVRIRSRAPAVINESPLANLPAEIFRLSKMFCEVCLHHRRGATREEWQVFENQMSNWPTFLHSSLSYNTVNFELHRAQNTLRPFTYLHLLYHHVCQLIYYSHLQYNSIRSQSEDTAIKIISCHDHASKVTQIVQYTWDTAHFDVHNVSVGQMLTVSAAIHMHACLTASSKEQVESAQAELLVISNCFTRIKEHCRIFSRISVQLDKFLEICSYSSSSKNVFDKSQRLIRHILHYGTAFERLNYRNAGRLAGLEVSSGSNSPPEPNTQPPVVPVTSAEYMDWRAMNIESSEDPFQNSAWLFSDVFLNDLYSMSYLDPIYPSGEINQNYSI